LRPSSIETIINQLITKCILENSSSNEVLKSQRFALIKLGDLCQHLTPNKCMSLAQPILHCFQTLLDKPSSPLLESIQISLSKLCPILVFYWREKDVHNLLFKLTNLLPNKVLPLPLPLPLKKKKN
jgi:hypothetical protein